MPFPESNDEDFGPNSEDFEPNYGFPIHKMIYLTGLQAPPDHFFKLSNENNLGNSDLQAHTEYPKNEDHDDNQRDWGPISPVRNPKKPLPMSGAGALEIPQEPVYTEVRR